MFLFGDIIELVWKGKPWIVFNYWYSPYNFGRYNCNMQRNQEASKNIILNILMRVIPAIAYPENLAVFLPGTNKSCIPARKEFAWLVVAWRLSLGC